MLETPDDAHRLIVIGCYDYQCIFGGSLSSPRTRDTHRLVELDGVPNCSGSVT